MSKKSYYISGFDEIHQLVETPASKERTDRNRFIITTVLASIGAVSGIVAAVVSVMTYLATA